MTSTAPSSTKPIASRDRHPSPAAIAMTRAPGRRLRPQLSLATASRMLTLASHCAGAGETESSALELVPGHGQPHGQRALSRTDLRSCRTAKYSLTRNGRWCRPQERTGVHKLRRQRVIEGLTDVRITPVLPVPPLLPLWCLGCVPFRLVCHLVPYRLLLCGSSVVPRRPWRPLGGGLRIGHLEQGDRWRSQGATLSGRKPGRPAQSSTAPVAAWSIAACPPPP